MREKKINIFLQARSDSHRLPFKSLLPINKIPLVVLCARRLKGKIFNVIVLTTNQKSDDYLVNILKKNKIKYFRGNLKNVYKRFLDASKNIDNNEIIIRATADNPFVDYLFAKNTLEVFLKNNDVYKGINHKKHNLPYGMSLEIFRKSLLSNNKKKLTKITMEHVTDQFYKFDNQKIVKKNKLVKNFSDLSCTLDTFKDYKKLNYIFKKFKNPIKTPWIKLIYELKKYKFTKSFYLPKTKYIIGGAQIGNNYSNFKKLEIEKIYKKNTLINNFTNIDTALNYSKSHEKISNINLKNKINIISKLNYSDINISKNFYKENFYLNFYKILIDLNRDKLDTLLIHSYKDFKKYNHEILKIFKKLESLKLIKKFGVSIYYPNELFFLMKNFLKLSIQFPINFIDYRWNNLNIDLLKNKSKSTLIARSIFLRGKLLEKKGYIKDYKTNVKFLKELSNIKKEYSIKSNLELCIKYVNSLKYLDNIIIGFENYDQIKQVVKYKNKKFSTKNIIEINKQFKFLKTKYIDIMKL